MIKSHEIIMVISIIIVTYGSRPIGNLDPLALSRNVRIDGICFHSNICTDSYICRSTAADLFQQLTALGKHTAPFPRQLRRWSRICWRTCIYTMDHSPCTFCILCYFFNQGMYDKICWCIWISSPCNDFYSFQSRAR